MTHRRSSSSTPKARVSRRAAALAFVPVALALTLTGCIPETHVVHATESRAFEITGYAEAGATTAEQLDASVPALNQVGIDGVNLTASGAGVDPPDAESLKLLAQAHAKHLQASLLFGNFSDAIGDFSDPLAEKMFRSSDNIRSVVAALKAQVKDAGWDGITVDLESLNQFGAPGHTRDDNAGLDAFVTQLRAELPNTPISICLVATPGSYKDLGYDLPTLAKQVDNVMLMAYDQHGPTWSDAGPVGGYPWVKASVASLATGVPKSQIQLGIGEYGYSWPAHGTGTTYTDAQARALVAKDSATATWSTTQLEWHATLRDGTTIWWSDARSYRARLALAHSLHLEGVAVWSLGEGDPLTK